MKPGGASVASARRSAQLRCAAPRLGHLAIFNLTCVLCALHQLLASRQSLLTSASNAWPPLPLSSARAMGDSEEALRDTLAAQARDAVEALRAVVHGPQLSLVEAVVGIDRLFKVLHAPADQDDTSAAALAALDAGALPLLTATLEKAACAAYDDSASHEARGRACFAIASLLLLAGVERGRAAAQSAPRMTAAVADALASPSTLDAAFCFHVCEAMLQLRACGALPSDTAVAATAGRGAALAVAHHSTGLLPTTFAVFVARELLAPSPEWPYERRESATAAFLAADGAQALLAAAEAHRETDTPLFEILHVLAHALRFASPARLARLSMEEDGRALRMLAHALRRPTLPPLAFEFCAGALRHMVLCDAVACALLSRTGVLDAAVACLQHTSALDCGVADRLRLSCVALLAEAAICSPDHPALPSDMPKALRVLARLTTVPGEHMSCRHEALHRLCRCPGVVDIALEVGVPAMLVAALEGCGSTRGCACCQALEGLMAFADVSVVAARGTLQAGGASAARRALRSHAHSADVAAAASHLLSVLADKCAHSIDVIGADGCWRLLVAALREHGAGSADLAVGACKALALATSDESARAAAATAGAIPAITAAMRAHDDNVELQKAGLFALGRFARAGPELADALDESHAPAAVAAALKRHGTQAEVVLGACSTLGELVFGCRETAPGCPDPDVFPRRAAAAAVAADAPAALLAALHQQGNCDLLSEHAPRALAALLVSLEWPPDGAAWRDTRDALVARMASQVGNPDVLGMVCRAASAAGRMPACIRDRAAGAAPPGVLAVFCAVLRDANSGVVHVAYFIDVAMGCADFARAPGGDGPAFCAEACAAGIVELLATTAATAALLDAAHPDYMANTAYWAALIALAELTARLPAAACRAAACGVQTLVDVSRRAGALEVLLQAHCDALIAMARRLRALVAAHESSSGAGGCAAPDCDLRLMRRHRCCLYDCAAVAADSAVSLKRYSSCRCAAYCCTVHQRQAWPRHKPVCKARAAVDAARSVLKAQAGAGGAAHGDADA